MFGKGLRSDRLYTWDQVSGQGNWSGILLGNGLSINVWPRFSYGSLYEEATRDETANRLEKDDQKVFREILGSNDTSLDFERVLAALWTTREVNKTLGLNGSAQKAAGCYSRIRLALVGAVNKVHLRWDPSLEEALRRIGTVLLSHQWIFTTNYDLLTYWALMGVQPTTFVDYFWNPGNSFDIFAGDPYRDRPRILYLHGGLHIFNDPARDMTYKLVKTSERTLLDLFDPEIEKGSIPIFVTEGTTQRKQDAISGSDYLQFAFERFREYDGDLVVFGHSLGAADKHIVDVVTAYPQRRVAVSVHVDDSDPYVPEELMKGLVYRLHPVEPLFFQANTHPLGTRDLRAYPDAEEAE